MLLTDLLADQPRVELHLLRVGHCRQLDALAHRDGRRRMIEFPSYAALVRHPDRPERGWTLVDTGYASHFRTATARLPERLYGALLPVTLPPAEELPRQLAARGIDPGDVRRVVVTHFHGDHVAGLRDYPAARIHCGAAGYRQVRSLSRLAATRHGLLPGLLPDDADDRVVTVESATPLVLEGAATLRGWDLLGDRSLVAVDLPGHMPGHVGVLLTSQDGSPVLLAGDAAWSTRAVVEDVPPSRLAGAAFDDWTAALGTLGDLHRLHRAHADAGLLVLPAHCADGYAAWTARADRSAG